MNHGRHLPRNPLTATAVLLLCACGSGADTQMSNAAASTGTMPGAPVGTGPVATDPTVPGPQSTLVPMDMLGPGPNASVGPVAGPAETNVGPTGAVAPTTPGPADPTPSTGPDPSSSAPGEPVAPPLDPALLDDFEDGDAAVVDVSGRKGTWNVYNDGTGTQTPASGSLTPEAPGADGSGMAIHTSGSGFSDWGAGIQVDLNNSGGGASSREPHDVSSYEGLSFFAKGTGNVRVEFVIGAITEASGGGTCTENCYDAHGKTIAVTPEWKQFTLRFDELAQEGWGAEAAFSAADLLGLNFKMMKPDEETPAEFDFWLDEVSFLKVGEGPAAEPEPEPEPPPEPSSEPGTCSPDLKRYDGNGSVTYYTFAMGSTEVNCSYQITGNNPDRVAHIYTGEGRFFGAMNTTDYNNAAMCGACVEVTRGDRRVLITIVDQCPVATNPKCQAGHIDLSLEAFRQIGSDVEGHLTGLSWQYVPCPVGDQNVTYRLKEPDRNDWNELLVQSHVFPITSVEIDGAQATRKAYNYWEPPGNMGPGPWTIKVTDVAGGVIESYVSRTEGELDAQTQFTCQ